MTSGRTAPQRGIRNAIALSTTIASLTVGAGVAAAGGGGLNVPDPPRLADVTCIATCAGTHKATVGSRVEARGRHLGNVKAMLFRQRGGGRVKGELLRVGAHTVRAKVPDGAKDGRPKVVDRFGNADVSPKTLRIVSPDRIPSDGGFKLQRAKATPGKTYFFGRHRAKMTYMFSGSEPVDIRIQVVHISNGKIVASRIKRGVEPNIQHTASWAGGARSPMGAYRFKVGPVSGKLDSSAGARFQYHKWKFPVRARHTYGDGFGAPRSGHRHQGQDLLARCGKRVVAARGGRVQYRGYQAGGAGYYLVIDGKRDSHDYVYMHLARRAAVREGQRVHTGEKVGIVGSTGSSTACHLHFEYWKNDWWNGGRALPSVTKVLKRWDRWS